MEIVRIILLAVAGINLYHDYKIDKGRHIKAKTINAIAIGLVIAMNAGLFQYLSWMLRKPDVVKGIWGTPIGFIPGEAHLLINVLNVFVGIALLLFVVGMTKRKESARKWTLRLLPVFAGIQIVSFYRGWIGDGDDSVSNQILAAGAGTFFIGGICILIIGIYKSGFMNDFFNRKDLSQVEN